MRPELRFLGLFALMATPFYVLMSTSAFLERLFPAYLHINAQIAASLLGLLGHQCTAAGTSIVSPGFSIRLAFGCDAVEPSGLYAAAVFAFPAPWRRRALGVFVGVLALLLLNLIRVVGLFLIGVHAGGLFDVFHTQVWQVLFIGACISIWVGWARWSLNRHVSRS